MISVVTDAVENMILLIIPKPATDAASSIPDMAIIMVGIPLATP